MQKVHGEIEALMAVDDRSTKQCATGSFEGPPDSGKELFELAAAETSAHLDALVAAA